MNFNQIKMFITVVERQGFSSAARHLNISPTAVSKQIKALEDILGVQLILRSTTKFEITEVGDLFYSHCKRVIKNVDDLEDIVRSFQSEPSGSLKVFSSIAFAEIYITPYVDEFIAQYPKIVLDLDINDRIPDIQRESIDLCFGLIKHWDQDLIQKKLFKTTAGIFASPSYLKDHKEPKSKDNLKEHLFICHSNRPDQFTVSFKKGDRIHIRPRVSVNDNAALLNFAKKGVGPIVLFDFIAQNLVEAGDLKQLLKSDEMVPETYHVYFPPSYHFKPASRLFLDFVFSKIK